MKIIEVNTGVFSKNNEIADEINKKMKKNNIRMLNFLGTPGSGKTTFLERIIEIYGNKHIAVIEGDLYTAKDSQRISKYGVRTVQLNTKGACHLEADMIKKALEELELDDVDTVVIDNIGNLVCTAEFRLGEDLRIVIFSVTEGNDKVEKYPLMFETADIIIVNKIDMVGFTDFDFDEFEKDVRKINAGCEIIRCSAANGYGIKNAIDIIDKKCKNI